MPISDHDVFTEFPDHKDEIQQLLTQDEEFASLVKEYHSIDRTVHRLEYANIPTSDERFEDLKKSRLLLKDQLYARLNGSSE